MFSIKKYIVALLLVVAAATGCKKLVEVKPPVTSVNADNVFTSDATAIAAMTGVYAKMSNDNAFMLTSNGLTATSLFTSLSADELDLFALASINLAAYYHNQLNPAIPTGLIWNSAYPAIFTANSVMEGLQAATGVSALVKQQLMGEAKFIRALNYFYLANCYGDVPIVSGTDWKVNSTLHKSPQADVYAFIVSDLKDAASLLSGSYLSADLLTVYPAASTERIRPTKWAALALLARTYLYTKDYADAESTAGQVIANTELFGMTTPSVTFLKNSVETIWALQDVQNGTHANTGDGSLFILTEAGPTAASNPVYLNKRLVQSFAAGDLRKQNWIDSVTPGATTFYYPAKYKIGQIAATVQEYTILLRFSELYLIRAEARAQLNDISGAQSDINVIRTRAGLPNTAAADQASLVTAVMAERRWEFFTEMGHRWFDLKRSGTINTVMTTAAVDKGATWKPYQANYPIPQNELLLAPGLVQNDGY